MSAPRLLRYATGFLLAAGVIVLCAVIFRPKYPPPLDLPAGSVEFLVVANYEDDIEAINATVSLFDAIADDPKQRAALQNLAIDGKPPRAPNGKFTVMNSTATYRWVELDPTCVENLFPRINPEGSLEWQRAEDARSTARPVRLDGSCIWSRKCENALLTEQERRARRFDWFLLLREPLPGNELNEKHLGDISAGTDDHTYRSVVLIQMTREGSKRLKRVTKENLSTDQIRRTLAIIIQDKVISFPTISSEISDRCQISGFDDKQVHELVRRVRSGGR